VEREHSKEKLQRRKIAGGERTQLREITEKENSKIKNKIK
jgi:hypothetical protein